jgi:hypothetical protein
MAEGWSAPLSITVLSYRGWMVWAFDPYPVSQFMALSRHGGRSPPYHAHHYCAGQPLGCPAREESAGQECPAGRELILSGTDTLVRPAGRTRGRDKPSVPEVSPMADPHTAGEAVPTLAAINICHHKTVHQQKTPSRVLQTPMAGPAAAGGDHHWIQRHTLRSAFAPAGPGLCRTLRHRSQSCRLLFLLSSVLVRRSVGAAGFLVRRSRPVQGTGRDCVKKAFTSSRPSSWWR